MESETLKIFRLAKNKGRSFQSSEGQNNVGRDSHKQGIKSNRYKFNRTNHTEQSRFPSYKFLVFLLPFFFFNIGCSLGNHRNFVFCSLWYLTQQFDINGSSLYGNDPFSGFGEKHSLVHSIESDSLRSTQTIPKGPTCHNCRPSFRNPAGGK